MDGLNGLSNWVHCEDPACHRDDDEEVLCVVQQRQSVHRLKVFAFFHSFYCQRFHTTQLIK